MFLPEHGPPEHEHGIHRLAVSHIRPGSLVAIFPARHYPTTPWHEHDFFELALIESGRGQHVTDQGVEQIERGAAFLLSPGTGHEYRGGEELHVYNCLFRAELADAELLWARRDPHLGVLFELDAAVDERTGARIVRMHLDDDQVDRVIAALEPIRTGEPDASTRAGQLAHLIMALDVVAVARHHALATTGSPRTMPPLVSDALALLDTDLAYPWSLDDLSARLNVGRFHLTRLFTRSLGVPPMRYLERLRARRAATLLSATESSVAAVGAAVGWPDPAHFSRRFRAVFGASPRAYRQRLSR